MIQNLVTNLNEITDREGDIMITVTVWLKLMNHCNLGMVYV
jgi:hypothetical protein